MRGVYIVKGSAITVASAACTLAILHSESSGLGSVLEVMRAWVSQFVAAPDDEMQSIALMEKSSAFGTYTAATPEPTTPGDVASEITGATTGAAGTAGIDASAEGAGTEREIYPDSFHLKSGWLWLPTPDERIILGPDKALILKLTTTPTTTTGWSFGLEFRAIW
jgi:hypothetical protein